jgi:hypothetical protein
VNDRSRHGSHTRMYFGICSLRGLHAYLNPAGCQARDKTMPSITRLSQSARVMSEDCSADSWSDFMVRACSSAGQSATSPSTTYRWSGIDRHDIMDPRLMITNLFRRDLTNSKKADNSERTFGRHPKHSDICIKSTIHHLWANYLCNY